jgi:hypothetical protein
MTNAKITLHISPTNLKDFWFLSVVNITIKRFTRHFTFPMETFLTLTSIRMQWQTIHYMVWGLQGLFFASSLTTKEPLVTYNAMPRIPHALVDEKLWDKKCPRCISLYIQCFLGSLNSTFG